jgi:hypothetical protein
MAASTPILMGAANSSGSVREEMVDRLDCDQPIAS